MTTEVAYPVCWVLADGERHLLWRNGGAKPDEYVRARQSHNILVARSVRGLSRAARSSGFELSEEKPQVIDLRVIRTVLRSIRPGRPLSKRSASVLLEAWNALEDLERSIGQPFMTSKAFRKEAIDAVYEKLFFGLNLPPVTPAGCCYHPVLSEYERAALRSILRKGLSAAESFL